MLPKLCHLDNDLVIISILYIYILRSNLRLVVVHIHIPLPGTSVPYLGAFFFSHGTYLGTPDKNLKRHPDAEADACGSALRHVPLQRGFSGAQARTLSTVSRRRRSDSSVRTAGGFAVGRPTPPAPSMIEMPRRNER